MPLAHQVRDAQGQRRLQPDDAARGLGERPRLLLGAVRRVVGRDDVDGAVFESLDDGVAVGVRAQRRVHLGHGALFEHGLLRQREMVRRRLGGDARAELLGQANHLHGVARADVLDVHARPGMQRQHAVARHQHVLGQRRSPAQPQRLRHRTGVHARRGDERLVFLVERQRQVELRRALHRFLHQRLVHERDAVVGESRRAGRGKPLHVDDFLAGKVFADGSAGEHVDAACGALVQHIAQRLFVVDGGLGVRHAHDRREPAGRRRCRPAFDVLFIGEARVAEVHVHVHQPRRHDAALGLHDALVVVRALILADLRDLAVFQNQVEHVVDAALRVDDAAVFHQDHRASSFKCW